MCAESKLVKVTSFVSSRSTDVLENGFEKLGVWIYRKPWAFLLAGVILVLLCGLGFLNFEMESDVNKLYIPSTSEIYAQYQRYQKFFGTFPEFILLQQSTRDGSSVLTPECLDEAYVAFNATLDLTAVYNKVTYDLADVCVHPNPASDECQSIQTSFLNIFFSLDASNWQSQASINARLNYAPIVSYVAKFVGDQSVNESSAYDFNAGSVLVTPLMLAGTTDAEFYAAMQAFQDAFLLYWVEHDGDFALTDISYASSKSMSDEINRSLTADFHLFIIAFVLMLVYLQVSLSKMSCIGARLWLASSSILLLFMSLVMGFGLGLLFSAKITSLCGLVPFIIMGVGVDDVIIIIDTLKRTPLPNNDPANKDKQLGLALRHSGISVSLTSFCSVTAFAIGSSTDLIGIQYFCVFATMIFFSEYLLQFLVFVPLLVYSNKRMDSNRNFCCCCYVHEEADGDGKDDIQSNLEFAIQSTASPTEQQKDVDSVDGGTAANTGTANDEAPAALIQDKSDDADNFVDERDETAGDAGDGDGDGDEKKRYQTFSLENLLDHTLVWLLSNRWRRLLVIVVFIVTFGLSIASLAHVSTQYDTVRLIPDDSYLVNFLNIRERAFGKAAFAELVIVLEDVDFSDAQERAKVHEMIGAMNALEESITNVNGWLDSFETFAETQSNQTIGNLSSTQFYSYLLQYSEHDDYNEWSDELIFDDPINPTRVKVTKFYLDIFQGSAMNTRWKARTTYFDTFQKYFDKKHGYPFEVTWMLAFFAYSVVILTVNNMIYAGLTVLVILLLVLDMRLAIFIAVIIAWIDVALFGWMFMFGIPLDAITFAQCVMAVGLTVDYVIHMVHAIAYANPKNKSDYRYRLRKAYLGNGASVMKGAFTTFLGSISLAFSGTEAFRSFFAMYAGIIIVAVLHGMILAPALMGEMQFVYSGLDAQWKHHFVAHVKKQKTIEMENQKMKSNSVVEDDN